LSSITAGVSRYSALNCILAMAWVMVHAAKSGQRNPAEPGYGTQCPTIFVEDVEDHYARTRAVGASIVEELHETVQLFSRHVRDIDPAARGSGGYQSDMKSGELPDERTTTSP